MPTKSWKNHPQKLLRITQIRFFPLLPELTKRPKQKNSCSKMWPIDQLCKELGDSLHYSRSKISTFCLHLFLLKSNKTIILITYGIIKKLFFSIKFLYLATKPLHSKILSLFFSGLVETSTKGQIKPKSRLAHRRFSQKMNGRIWFVCREE